LGFFFLNQIQICSLLLLVPSLIYSLSSLVSDRKCLSKSSGVPVQIVPCQNFYCQFHSLPMSPINSD
jgi:hypothetical protein